MIIYPKIVPRYVSEGKIWALKTQNLLKLSPQELSFSTENIIWLDTNLQFCFYSFGGESYSEVRDTVWAKYEYEIELRLKIVRFSIQFGFDSSTDGKMNWNIPNCFSWTLNMAENISNVWIYCKAEGMGKKWARNWANIYEFLFLS